MEEMLTFYENTHSLIRPVMTQMRGGPMATPGPPCWRRTCARDEVLRANEGPTPGPAPRRAIDTAWAGSRSNKIFRRLLREKVAQRSKVHACRARALTPTLVPCSRRTHILKESYILFNDSSTRSLISYLTNNESYNRVHQLQYNNNTIYRTRPAVTQ